MKAIILSGGRGLRLRPLTANQPKPLVRVNGRPISEYQIEWLTKGTGISGVIFACGYKWEKLKKHYGSRYNGVSVRYSVEEEPLGTGGALKKAFSLLGEAKTVVATNGDIITDLQLKPMIRAHRRSGAVVTMLVVPYRSRFGVVHIDENGAVKMFEEKPVFPSIWINGGVYVMDVQRVAPLLPERGDVERDTFPRLVSRGEIMSYRHDGRWWYIDSVKDLKEVESELSAQLSP
jgi:mannose-1-phosphate guanylyltransferase